MNIEIPENNSEELDAIARRKHESELELIAKQFLAKLQTSDSAVINCCEHMITNDIYHHLCDTIEVARMFKQKGYKCYYYDYYNSYGVNQRCVCVRKTSMPANERSCGRRTWKEIS